MAFGIPLIWRMGTSVSFPQSVSAVDCQIFFFRDLFSYTFFRKLLRENLPTFSVKPLKSDTSIDNFIKAEACKESKIYPLFSWKNLNVTFLDRETMLNLKHSGPVLTLSSNQCVQVHSNSQPACHWLKMLAFNGKGHAITVLVLIFHGCVTLGEQDARSAGFNRIHRC